MIILERRLSNAMHVVATVPGPRPNKLLGDWADRNSRRTQLEDCQQSWIQNVTLWDGAV